MLLICSLVRENVGLCCFQKVENLQGKQYNICV